MARCPAALAGAGHVWFLVMGPTCADRGDVSIVKGRLIGAAPWVEMGLRRCWWNRDRSGKRSGADCSCPGAIGARVFGVTAAEHSSRKDRQVLGKRHGRRSSARRFRDRRSRRQARRRTEELLSTTRWLHRGVRALIARAPDKAAAASERSSRRKPAWSGVARSARSGASCSAGGSAADRRPDTPRSPYYDPTISRDPSTA